MLCLATWLLAVIISTCLGEERGEKIFSFLLVLAKRDPREQNPDIGDCPSISNVSSNHWYLESFVDCHICSICVCISGICDLSLVFFTCIFKLFYCFALRYLGRILLPHGGPACWNSRWAVICNLQRPERTSRLAVMTK